MLYSHLTRRPLSFLALAIAWIAGSTTSAAPSNRLQALVDDTAAQIQIAYRQHPDERAYRQQQLASAIAAWRVAPRREANNEQLSTWLHAAIRSSMPGSHESMPAVPTFDAAPKIESRLVNSARATKTNDLPVAKPEADPFGDDPVNERE
jgi:hypothetical protein